MAKKEQPAQSEGRRYFSLVRLLILIIGLLLIAIGATLWFLSNAHVINADWSNVLSIVFGVLGVVLTFIFWLFPFPTYSPKEENHLAEARKQAANSTNSQNLSLQQAHQVQQIQNVQTLQQFFSVADSSERQGSVSSNSLLQSMVTKSENPLLDPEMIFQFNIELPTSTEFYGRDNARQTLISRTRNRSSTSIVGPRRIGKTWLMNYLHLVAPQELESRFRLSYIDATMPSCATKQGFITAVIEELVKNTIIQHTEVGLDTLEKVVKDLRLRNQVPVLCIDEFEGLCNPHEFDLSFFTGLRAIAQAGLVLVVASKLALNSMVAGNIKTSPFFNIFAQLTLKPFTKEEAEKFVSNKGKLAGFTPQEQQYLLEYGQGDQLQWPPLRLQLTGRTLLEDKNNAITLGSHYYRPNDADYWTDFKRRLDEAYQGAIGK